MNRNQSVGLGCAIVAVFIAFAFPPYIDDSGLIGGTVYFPFQKPPSEPYIFYNGGLLAWELAFVVLSLCAALIAFRSKSRGRQKVCLLVGLVVEAVILVCSLPNFSMILGPEFTWFLLDVLAVVLLGSVLLLGRGRDVIEGVVKSRGSQTICAPRCVESDSTSC